MQVQDWLKRGVLMLDKDTLLELEAVETKLNELLPKLSKDKVRELKTLVLKHYITAFNVKNKPLKYGTLNKGFNSQELDAFLSIARQSNRKFFLLFWSMSSIGLRIGEAIRIRLSDINQSTREIKILSEKTHVPNLLIIPLPLFNELKDYINENKASIDRAQGYVFFADKETSHAKRLEPWLEQNYVRKVFRSYLGLAGLDEVYGESDETRGRSVRHLHRLTTHSLRHHAITKFAKQSNGNLILTSRFARHLKPETTMLYVHSDKSELYSFVEQMARTPKL